ncbi:MAG: ABC transporter permease [Ginsengibacter sp.]
MFINYFKTTFRNLWRNKLNSIINITGLAVSIACCIVVYVLVKHETTFDNFNSKADRIYRIVFEDKTARGTDYVGSSTFALAPALRNDFPNLETVTQVFSKINAIIEIPGKNGSRKLFEEKQLTYTDPEFFKTFDISLLAGNIHNLLSNLNEVILSKDLADKYFGNDFHSNYNALIGKTIIVNKNPYRISAIMKNMPSNSNVACNMMLPFAVYASENEKGVHDWRENYGHSCTFVTLPKGFSPQQFDKNLIAFKNKYLDKESAAQETYLAQPLEKVHTDTSYGGTLYATPAILLIAFIAMAVIILLTSCVNFINLATAQSLNRAKEIGIRKTLGSRKWQLILGFMCETFLLVAIATVIAVALSSWSLNAINQYLAFIIVFDLHFDYTIFFFLTALALIITILAGFYPAKILAGYKPIEALKNKIKAKNAGFANRFSLRKGLVVTQFLITQLMIICTIVVASQIKYFYNKDLGYRKTGIETVEIPSNDQRKIDVFRNQVMALAGVKNITFSSGPPTSAITSSTEIRLPSSPAKDNISIERKFVDEHYLPTFNIKLVAGRNLQQTDKVFLSDSLSNYNIIVNEIAIKSLGFQNPNDALGKTILVDDKKHATIVGVTANFDNASLQQENTPVLMFNCTNWVAMASIEMNTTSNAGTIASIKKSWESLYPDNIFSAMTLKGYIKHKAFYLIQDIMYKGFNFFVLLSIFIGCMGLYGLVAFLALQRQKEIGIRKVLGASVKGIVFLFSKEFIWLIAIAFVIAAPLAYLAMNAWLQSFANRIEIHVSYFLIAFLLSLFIAGITVGYQSVKAAVANPVDSLRSE